VNEVERSAALQLVAQGYDRVAGRYLRSRQGADVTSRRFLEVVDERIPSGSLVLDLGCGAGVPVTRTLMNQRRVVGIELSSHQLSLARSLVPSARLVQGDMMRLPFRAAAFDAVVATFSFVHVPRDEQQPTLRAVAGCLRSGGVFAANFGTGASEDAIQPDWLDVPMFFASFEPDTNERMVRLAGLEIESSEVRAVDEEGEPVDFHWVVAKKA
jgi:ubiquinone/menaquinone biosynthesis C-methylase UbiE